jgi:recombination protein RecT
MSNQLTKAEFTTTLTKFEGRISSLLENTPLTLTRLKAICENAVSRNSKLLECTPASLFGAIITACELGLEPNTPNQFCAIVPYNKKNGNNWETHAQLQLMYQGIIELAYRTNQIAKIHTEIVFEGDYFEEILGTDVSITHKRTDNTKTDKPIAVYAVATMNNGQVHYCTLSKDVVMKAKDISKTKWAGFEANDINYNMWRKTAIKQLFKTLPKSNSAISSAIKLDNQEPIINIDLETGEVIEEIAIAEEVKETEIKPSI